MPLRFDSDPREATYQVIQFKLREPIAVIVASDPSYVVRHALHWLNDQSRTVPCLHEDCPWCPAIPIRLCNYLPALAHSHAYRSWRPKILAVTAQMGEFLKEPRESIIWTFERKAHARGPVVWRNEEKLLNPQPFVGFDVIPSLERMWGMYGKMKRSLPSIDPDRPKLLDAG